MQVRAENIKKEFIRRSGETNVFTAVKPCSITLFPGKLTVVRGRSGGGKSTLLNILSGILTPTEGKVFYDDRDIFTLSDEELSAFRNQNIGYIPQGKSAVSSLTVKENILLPLALYGETDEAEAERLMELLDLAALKDAYPAEMSGGELRRMAIARALIRKPSVLFADEPTGDLDDENTALVFQILRDAASDGMTVMVVTHEGEAAGYADRIFRMDGGNLTAAEKTISEDTAASTEPTTSTNTTASADAGTR